MKFTLLKWIGFLALTLIYKTCKIEIKGQKYFDQTYQNGKPTLLCVWHGRMLFPIYYVKIKYLSPVSDQLLQSGRFFSLPFPGFPV